LDAAGIRKRIQGWQDDDPMMVAGETAEVGGDSVAVDGG
jgi:hypothetical protein